MVGIQELSKINDGLQQQVTNQQSTIDTLQQIVSNQQSTIDTLQQQVSTLIQQMALLLQK
jgi:uncharacterized coiled-coil protein SlyX